MVRIGPNEVSRCATSGELWKTIYGHRPEMRKSHDGTGLPGPAGTPDISNCDEKNHARMRKALIPAFAERALREQERTLMLYIDKLMTRLQGAAPKGRLNIVNYFNWTTFDIIGDFAFGESFEGSDKVRFHPWVSSFLDSTWAITYENAIHSYRLTSLVEPFIPKKLKEARANFWGFGGRKIDARLMLEKKEEEEDRKDLVGYMTTNVDPDAGMNRRELAMNASQLAFAGSETGGTFCSGAVYLMLKNPPVYEKLCNEVRCAFKKEQVRMSIAGQLKYLNCVVQETFRVYEG